MKLYHSFLLMKEGKLSPLGNVIIPFILLSRPAVFRCYLFSYFHFQLSLAIFSLNILISGLFHLSQWWTLHATNAFEKSRFKSSVKSVTTNVQKLMKQKLPAFTFDFYYCSIKWVESINLTSKHNACSTRTNANLFANQWVPITASSLYIYIYVFIRLR